MKQSKSIAVIGSRGIPAEFGGFETFAEQLSIRLVDKGFSVTVFCEDTQNYREDNYKGVKLIYVKTPNIVGVRSIWFDLVNIIRTLRGYDVVYMLGYNTAFAFILPWLFRTNFWVNMDGMEWKRDKWSPFAKRYLKINEWLAAKFSRKLIADAQGIADHLEQAYGVAHKIEMIPYGAFSIEKEPDIELIADLDLVSDDYYLVVCRLEPENHVQEIIDGFVASKLSQQLIVVGDNKSGTEYVNNLLQNTDERVRFIGTIYDQKKLETLRYHCKAYLHGHSVGGTNPSLLEAMAAGNYVIAHDNVFNREVTGEQAAFFKGSTDLSTFLNKYQNKAYPQKTKQLIKERITKTYNWASITERYEKAFFSNKF